MFISRTVILLRFLLLSSALCLASAHAQDVPTLLKSVVKIENSRAQYDYTKPWNAPSFGGGTGTGFHIGENRFLTNAHVVSASRRLMITLPGDPTPRPAKLVHIAHDCDLAMFALDDPAASKNLPALPIGDTPSLDDEVRVIGYPVGGERVSLTRGVVSRIDYTLYSHSMADQHLSVQIDAAINPGNSGGPVLKDGKVVGVAFQGLTQAENTGYMIPPPVIERFLTDVEDGEYDGYVELGIQIFPLLNPALRKANGLADDGLGVLLSDLIATGSADGYLQKNDILLSMDGNPVASNGTVIIDGQRVNMAEVVERLFVDDVVVVEIIREGEKMNIEVPLRTLPAYKIMAADYDNAPRYVVSAGLVFQPVNRNLLSMMEGGSGVSEALQEYLDEDGFLEKPDIVVLTQVLSASLNSGLERFSGSVVESIDGQEVRTIHDVYRLLNASFENPFDDEASPFIEIQMRDNPQPLLLPREEAASGHADVIRRYGLREDARLGLELKFERSATALAAEKQPEVGSDDAEPEVGEETETQQPKEEQNKEGQDKEGQDKEGQDKEESLQPATSATEQN